MSADLATVCAAADRRREAQAALDVAVRDLHGAIRDAHGDRWRIAQIAQAAGMHRVTVHEVLRGARYGTETAATSEMGAA